MKTVKIYCPETKQTAEIPASELAPGMVRTHIVGKSDVTYLPVSSLLKYQFLPPKALPEGLAQIATDVYGLIKTHLTWIPDVARWIAGFETDMHPAREVTAWMRLACVLHEMTHDGEDGPEIQREVFEVCVEAMNNGEDGVHTMQLSRLSNSRGKAIVKRYCTLSPEEFLGFWVERTDVDRWFELWSAEGGNVAAA